MKRLRWLSCGLSLPVLAACMHGAAEPAVLSGDREAGIREIESTISSMLHGTPVDIAGSAFSQSAELILERPSALRTGRTLEQPEHFRLWLKSGTCVLEHAESGATRELSSIRCRPVN